MSQTANFALRFALVVALSAPTWSTDRTFPNAAAAEPASELPRLIVPSSARPMPGKSMQRISDGDWQPTNNKAAAVQNHELKRPTLPQPTIPVASDATAPGEAQRNDEVRLTAGEGPELYSPPVPSVPLGGRRRPPAGSGSPGIAPPAAPLPPAPEATVDDGSSPPTLAPVEPPKSILKRPGTSGGGLAPLPSNAAEPELEVPSKEPGSLSDQNSSRRAPPKTPVGGKTTGEPAAPNAQPTSIREMSFRSVAPHLRLETRGPQAITLGKETRYYFDLFNEGDAEAPEVQVRVVLPNTLRIESLGDGATVHADPAGQRVMWVVPAVEPRGRKTLEARVVATDGRAVELAVDWAFRPAGHKAQIAVRQPQLQVAVNGPGEMNFGEEKSFRVVVSNTGSGDAENVVLTTGATGNRVQKFEIGLLPGGQQKELTVSLVANQPGEMDVEAVVTTDSDARADTASKVLVRRAELAAAIESPPLKYAGTTAAIAVSVANTGNTAANDVQLSLTLPTGAKFLGGVDGVAQAGNTVKWRVGQVTAGGERTYELQVQLNTAGDNRLDVLAQGAGAGVQAVAQTVTKVEALADLKLSVNNPPGPFAAGGEVTYEIQVQNRGTNVAKQLKVVMHFSEGMEPASVEGVQAKIVPGQVICDPVAQLDAGEKLLLKVKARGESAGAHLYRVEVFSTEPEERLVTEGTTRFYADTTIGGNRVGRKPAGTTQN